MKYQTKPSDHLSNK